MFCVANASGRGDTLSSSVREKEAGQGLLCGRGNESLGEAGREH